MSRNSWKDPNVLTQSFVLKKKSFFLSSSVSFSAFCFGWGLNGAFFLKGFKKLGPMGPCFDSYDSDITAGQPLNAILPCITLLTMLLLLIILKQIFCKKSAFFTLILICAEILQIAEFLHPLGPLIWPYVFPT